MTKYKKGKIARAIVTGITKYGIFVSLDEYYSGLIHISEVSHGFVKDMNDFVKMGETIYVEVLEISETEQHMKLSIKNIEYRLQKKGVSKKGIIETPMGFRTLSHNLPFWIEESLKKIQNFSNSIDKQSIK